MKLFNNSNLIPKPTLQRLPGYLTYLRMRQKEAITNISATTIANDLKLNPVLARKDLAFISSGGRPKTGYDINELINDLKTFLGYDNVNEAILVGAGNLGKTLLSFNGFSDYGFKILAAFDTEEKLIGTVINGKPILPLDKLKAVCGRLKVNIGIITVPDKAAQEICDLLVECGILAIWNFAPVRLIVPENIIVQDENMAASLAILGNRLSEKLAVASQ